MLGSGFIGEFHTDGLRYVPDARVAANCGAGRERRDGVRDPLRQPARYDSIEAVCADPEVDLVVVSLPNHLHLEAVRSAAAPRQGRGLHEAARPERRRRPPRCSGSSRTAGVFHAYLENVVFSAEMVRMREMVEAGAIGRPTTFRAREGHSGPHAAHFWDAELAGGGALLDMASHGAEAARYIFGKDAAVRDGRSPGARRSSTATGRPARTTRSCSSASRTAGPRRWTCRGRPRAASRAASRPTATRGRIIQDMTSTPLRAFIERPAGYLGEKADADTGWVFPVPDETYAHGHDAMMRHVVEAFRDGVDAARDVPRRLRRQRDPRRRLPLDAERPLGSRSRPRRSPAAA